MQLKYLTYTDSELVVLATARDTRIEAKKEIHRRKRVGSWRLIAGWKSEINEDENQERVYAPGVEKLSKA